MWKLKRYLSVIFKVCFIMSEGNVNYNKDINQDQIHISPY